MTKRKPAAAPAIKPVLPARPPVSESRAAPGEAAVNKAVADTSAAARWTAGLPLGSRDEALALAAIFDVAVKAAGTGSPQVASNALAFNERLMRVIQGTDARLQSGSDRVPAHFKAPLAGKDAAAQGGRS